MTGLVLYNIRNTKRFFDVVDSCVAPVILHMPDNQIEDLRFNCTV